MAKKFDLSNSVNTGNTAIMNDQFLKSMLGCGNASIGLSQAEPLKVPLASLVPWHDEENASQPFRIYPIEKLMELAADMAAQGLLSPIIVRPFGNGYQILAGHNRAEAAKLNEWHEIEAKILDVDDDAARLIMVNSNLLQREKILPSEKARAYKIQLQALKRQGQRTDLTCTQIEHKSESTKSRDILAEQMGENSNQIQRYIRLNELIQPLLDMVDFEQLGFTVGVSLSNLSQPKQQLLLDIMNLHSIVSIKWKTSGIFQIARRITGRADNSANTWYH